MEILKGFGFDLQLFAADTDWRDGITLTAGSGGASTSTLYIDNAGVVDAAKQAGQTYVGEIHLKSAAVFTAGAVVAETDISSVNVAGAVATTIGAAPSYSITDTATAKTVWGLGGAVNKVSGSSLIFASGKLTGFKDLAVNLGTVDVTSASGTGTLGGRSVTASNVTATFSATAASAVANFDSGSIVVPDGAGAFGLNGVSLTNVGGTFEGLEDSSNNKYTSAVLSGTAVTLDLDKADRAFFVTGTSGADKFTTDATNNKNATIFGGAGNDTISIAGTGVVSISGGDGNDHISDAGVNIGTSSTILGGAGNDTIDLSAATAGSNLWIDAGDGTNEVNISNAAGANKITNSTVTGGSGTTTFKSSDKTNVLVGGSGTNYFAIGDDTLKANISNYSYGKDYLVLTAAAGAIPGLVDGLVAANLKSDGSNGYILNDGATVGDATISSSSGFFAVTMTNASKEKVGLGWVGDTPVTIDASGTTNQVMLVGTTNSEADLLIGGEKADTIYAGAGDSVYGGAGNDSIKIATATTYGVRVGLSTAGGADTVANFATGWDIDSADAIELMGGTADDLKIVNNGAGKDISLRSGSATLTINGKGTATDEKVLISGKKVDVIAKNATVQVTDDSTIADYYVGTEASAIDLSTYSGNIEVNLSDERFRNITTLQAGTGNMSVLGGKAAESLVGGSGATSLYGGAGKDTLKSGAGKTTFFANESSGKDVVVDFAVGTSDTSDVINVNNLKSLTRSDNTNFTVDLDGTNSLKVTQKSGDINSNIQWASGDASGVVKIGKSSSDNKFSYDVATTNYVGSTKTDTVSLASGTTDSFEVWVDQTGDMFNSIEVYDFSQTTGDVLAAGKNGVSETIVAGKGNSSLWGGTGSTKDVLVNKNSSATAEFFYGMGDGNDEIQGQKGDSVNLYNLSVSDITKATINSNNVVFTTSANETVTVSGSVGTFKLADGSSWTADYSKKSWTQN